MQLSFIIYPAYKLDYNKNEAPIYIDLYEIFPKTYQVYIKNDMVTQYLAFLNLEKNKETIARMLIKQLSDPLSNKITLFKPTTPYLKYQEMVDKFILGLDINKDVYPILYKRLNLKNSLAEPNISVNKIRMVADYNIAFDGSDFSISDDSDSIKSTITVLSQVATEMINENELPDLKDELLNDKEFLTELVRASLKK